jgi:hypothetical protein
LRQWNNNKDSISKYEIVRQIIAELNTKGETCLRERREILKRVVEYESFTSCWPGDQLKARGLVAEVQKVVNVKDSFTRIANEHEAERQAHKAAKQVEFEKANKKKQDIAKIRSDLFALFSEINRHKRGKALEGVLNSLFKIYGIHIREAFTLNGEEKEGIVEQIDGVVEIDGHLYFVEMKWWEKPIGVPEISQHLVRVYHRPEGRAIIISASDFTEPAVATCKDALLQQKVVVLCTLQEFVMLLEGEGDLVQFLKDKIHSAIIDRKPYTKL